MMREAVIVPMKRRVEQGRYEIDVRLVADAILARIMAPPGRLPAAIDPHRACSKPFSSPGASRNTASG